MPPPVNIAELIAEIRVEQAQLRERIDAMAAAAIETERQLAIARGDLRIARAYVSELEREREQLLRGGAFYFGPRGTA